MQTTNKTVRYYIDREADTPIIRTVPVSRPAPSAPATTDQATVTPSESPSHHRDSRRRLTSMVQAGVRKYRHHDS